MRVAIVVEDDSAVHCLKALTGRGCKVLAVAANPSQCIVFGRQCMEQGIGFLPMQDQELVVATIKGFNAEIVVCVEGHVHTLPLLEALGDDGPKRYLLRAGLALAGAPSPEFGPIWLSHTQSEVSLLASGTSDVVSSTSVPVGVDDTAITLKLKHAQAAAALLEAHVTGGDEKSQIHAAMEPKPMDEGEVPATIDVKWDEEKVDRFVRAKLFPPHDPAVVLDPESGEEYFIENLRQWQELYPSLQGAKPEEGYGAPAGNGGYAADTHWYSNVGGTIVKVGDTNIHRPLKVTEKKKGVALPGAALGTRKKLRMNEPLIGPNAERYCTKALDSGWIGVEGPYVKQFEKHLARICGCDAACAVQSGTAALYGAMKALGVADPSHHVLVPAFTCAACADAIVHAGGLPIPIDCDMDSYGISLEAVRRGLEDTDVVGVVLAPCYGVPARDSLAIISLCKEKGLWVCEDACESYGAHLASSDGGKVPVGALATLTVVSVRSEKMIGVGEGGAILGNDSVLVAKAKWWCSRAPSRGAGLWRVYEHDAVGQNFRLPEMLAAVGCAASEMFPVMLERKRNIHQWYAEVFAKDPALQDIRLQKESLGDESVWWINAALLPEGMSGEEVGMRLMRDFPDIEIRPGFFPLNMMKIFRSKWSGPCPNAEALYKRLVCLPSSHQLLREDIDRISTALVAVMQAVGPQSVTES